MKLFLAKGCFQLTWCFVAKESKILLNGGWLEASCSSQFEVF